MTVPPQPPHLFPAAARKNLALLVVAFVALGALYASVLPPFEPPDEGPHLVNVDVLARDGVYPVATTRTETLARFTDQAHQQPTYYLLLAPLWRLALPGVPLADVMTRDPVSSNGAVRGFNARVMLRPMHLPPDVTRAIDLVRAANLVMAAATLLGVAAAGAWVGGARVGVLSALVAASVPGVLHISASVNNDNLINVACAWAIALTLRVWRRGGVGWGGALTLGVLTALAPATKLTGALMLAVVLLSVGLMALLRRLPAPDVRRALVGLALGALVLWGPVLARNALVYGDVFAANAAAQVWARGGTLSVGEALGVWQSFWDVYAHLTVAGPAWTMPYGTLLLLAGAGGAVLWAWRTRHAGNGWVLLFLAGTCVAVFAGVMLLTTRINISQGRHLVPALAAFAPLVALGLHTLLVRWAGVAVAPLALAALVAPWIVIAPAFPPVHTVDDAPPGLFRVDAAAETLTLVGVRAPALAKPGGVIEVEVVWRGRHDALALFFVTAEDPRDGTRLGNADTYMGGMDPASLDAATLYQGVMQVPLAAPMDGAPVQVRLVVGWRVPDVRDPGAGHFLPWQDGQGRPVDVVAVPGPVVWGVGAPPGSETATPLAVFSGVAHLQAVRLARHADGTLGVGLQWAAAGPGAAGAALTVGLVDADDVLIAQEDGPFSAYPPEAWQAAAPSWTTQHRLMLPPGTDANAARLRIGIYDPASGVRWGATDATGAPLPDDLWLGDAQS